MTVDDFGGWGFAYLDSQCNENVIYEQLLYERLLGDFDPCVSSSAALKCCAKGLQITYLFLKNVMCF